MYAEAFTQLQAAQDKAHRWTLARDVFVLVAALAVFFAVFNYTVVFLLVAAAATSAAVLVTAGGLNPARDDTAAAQAKLAAVESLPIKV